MLNMLSKLFNTASNQVRDISLTPGQRQSRSEMKDYLHLTKIAAVIGTIATLFFTAIFPSFFTFFTAGVFTFAATEVYKAAQNFLEILDQSTVEVASRATKESFINQIGKNTLLVEPVLRFWNPPLAGVVFI